MFTFVYSIGITNNNMNTTKPFGSLTTIEVAQLTYEQISAYINETGDESMVLKEVSDCRKRLKDMGINY